MFVIRFDVIFRANEYVKLNTVHSHCKWTLSNWDIIIIVTFDGLKWDITTIGLVIRILVQLKYTAAKWQRVEQFVEPVVCRAVDVSVLTQVLTQRRRVGGVVGVEVGRSVQHQHDQTLLAFHRHDFVVSHVELSHTVWAETRST